MTDKLNDDKSIPGEFKVLLDGKELFTGSHWQCVEYIQDFGIGWSFLKIDPPPPVEPQKIVIFN